jgi:hypothetical protein
MARSNNNNKLKAFVRFDGSGRIVPSSLIVQAFKPAVGNYKQIDAKECCNYTTTTTTTAVPTTTTTTIAPTTTTSTTAVPTTTTTTTLGINCVEYLVTNNDAFPGYLSYIDCNNEEIDEGLLNPGDFRQFCANANAAGGGIIAVLFEPTIVTLGACPV